MDTPHCDAFVVSAMALLDGETAPIDRAGIDAHVLTCRRCALEIDALRALARELASVNRATVTADVWPAIEARVHRNAANRTGLVLTGVCVCLVAWRMLEAATIDPLTLWTRLVAVGIAVVLFLWLRVNPFRVEPQLV